MARAAAVLIMMLSTLAHAEEMASYFETMYDKDVRLVLLPDQCDKSNVSMGWIAQAEQISTGDKAEGCWRYLGKDKVQLYLVVGERVYVDYVLPKTNFNAVFEE